MERLRAMTRPDFDAEILCCSGVQLFFEGAFGESLATLQNAVDVFDGRGPDARPPGGWLIPNDSRSVALTHLGLVLALVGETRAADARLEQAMAAAQSLPNYPTGAFTEAYVASYSGLVASLSQRYEDARACHEHALALGERYGMQFWLSTATAGCAIASGYLGDPRTSIEVLTPALEQWQSLGAGALVPFDLTHRGYLHLAVGDVDAALADVDAALALAEATTEQFFTAETHRVRASILLAAHPDDIPAVRAALATASDVAAHQGAWLFELRAALDVLELPGTRAAADVDHLRDLLARAPAGAAVPELARARAVVTG
jgi:tetratricopeptide (TPR) repeat protein